MIFHKKFWSIHFLMYIAPSNNIKKVEIMGETKQNYTSVKDELNPNKILFTTDSDNKIVYEVFKNIPHYENIYKCSNFGRILSKSRLIKHNRGNNSLLKDRILKQSPNEYGYLRVVLQSNGSIKTFKTHQLVAITFKNHKPDGTLKIICDHKDGIRTSNFEWNIQLITNRENSSKDQYKRNLTSKHVGVSLDKKSNLWVSQIRINGKVKKIGRFTNEIDASDAYQKELLKIQFISK